ncbi:hypothetical protein OAO01_04895 [Oligoflexia bacterium]|nr:hypothetical protein [Oligoflexia bacterium]
MATIEPVQTPQGSLAPTDSSKLRAKQPGDESQLQAGPADQSDAAILSAQDDAVKVEISSPLRSDLLAKA